jgi:hypothetical protein
MADSRSWYFYAEDNDRSWGWSNHVYTLGAAFQGFGDNATSAIAEAFEAKRPDLLEYCAGQEPFLDGDGNPEEMEDSLKAIPFDAEVAVSFTIPVELMEDASGE